MRILLVEDDADLAQFIRKGLKEERYAVDVASNGEQGFELGIANPYDLIILDIMLPVLDGLSLCRRLRSTGVTAPVLLLTARDTVQDKVSGLDLGADDYLTKPFAFAELLARARAILRRGVKLGQARGAALCGLAGSGASVFEYTPRAVKLALTGAGGAEKTQVQHMVKALLGIDGRLAMDASDALAVALCHVSHRSLRLSIGAKVAR